MRDPDRIDLILARIAAVWSQWPDLRLGQLIDNATHTVDIFYVEDEDLADDIEAFYAKLIGGNNAGRITNGGPSPNATNP